MYLIILLFAGFVQDNAYNLPEWFYEPPIHTISVVVSDSYYEESRSRAMEKEANRLLQIETSQLELYGYEALEKGIRSKQFDKFDLVHKTIGINPNRNVLKELGYVLLDHERVNRKFVVALYGREGTGFKNKRVSLLEKPSWLIESVQDNKVATGFAVNNYYMTSNWTSAFKHALFNLAGSNNIYIYKNLNQQTDSDENSVSKSYYNVQLNFVEAVVNGARITNRWIDPSDGSCHVRIETGD